MAVFAVEPVADKQAESEAVPAAGKQAVSVVVPAVGPAAGKQAVSVVVPAAGPAADKQAVSGIEVEAESVVPVPELPELALPAMRRRRCCRILLHR